MDENRLNVTPATVTPAPVAVLNPAGKDREQCFPDFAGEPERTMQAGHAPINFHAWAACTRGSFHADTHAAIATGSPIILLLRGNLKDSLTALQTIKQQDSQRKVAVCFKETGTHQITQLLNRKGTLARLQEIVNLADGCLAANSFPVGLFRSLRPNSPPETVQFLPTPYPVTDERWNFSRPISEREGILLGTREFETLSRNHLLALIALKRFSVPLTAMNTDGRKGRRRFQELNFPAGQLRITEGKFGYVDYLRWIAGHRLVFQLDQSFVPGQVAGDALLCRVPCVGGNGVVDEIAFPNCSHGLHDLDACLHTVAQLLHNDDAHAQCVEKSQQLARAELSFSVIAEKLTSFFAQLNS